MGLTRLGDQYVSNNYQEIINRNKVEIKNLKAQVEMLEGYIESLTGTDIREHNSESVVWLSAWRNTTKRLAKEALKKLKQMRGSE